jgi:pimeloyl-ACP methyl ester carboxylesterase
MEPIQIEFFCEGACVRGRFFIAEGVGKPHTFLYVPGWPATEEDFLGLGPLLSEQGIQMMEFYPRGLHPSEGIQSFTNTLNDIKSALMWLKQADVQRRFKVDPNRLVLGGYSYGGGMAMAYAAQDASVRRVISIAGNDHGEFARELQRNTAFAEGIRQWLESTRTPEGPARFDLEAIFKELFDHPEIYGLRENASKLADRMILLLGGWEDQGVTIDQYLLPLYRALKGAGAEKIIFNVYHTDHSFRNVRRRLASDIAYWILREQDVSNVPNS